MGSCRGWLDLPQVMGFWARHGALMEIMGMGRMGRLTAWAMMAAIVWATPALAPSAAKADTPIRWSSAGMATCADWTKSRTGPMREAFVGWLMGYVDGRQYGSSALRAGLRDWPIARQVEAVTTQCAADPTMRMWEAASLALVKAEVDGAIESGLGKQAQ